jgi:hypothetical protein
MWTVEEVFDNGLNQPLVVAMVCIGAALVMTLNLLAVRREIESVRVQTPERVQLEEQARLGSASPAPSAATDATVATDEWQIS